MMEQDRNTYQTRAKKAQLEIDELKIKLQSASKVSNRAKKLLYEINFNS